LIASGLGKWQDNKSLADRIIGVLLFGVVIALLIQGLENGRFPIALLDGSNLLEESKNLE